MMDGFVWTMVGSLAGVIVCAVVQERFDALKNKLKDAEKRASDWEAAAIRGLAMLKELKESSEDRRVLTRAGLRNS